MSGFRQQGNVHSRVPVPADFGVTSKIPVLVMIFDAVSDQEFLVLPALQLQHRFLVAPVPHYSSGFPLETAEAKSGEFYGPLGKGGATGSHDSGEYKGPVGVLKKERPAGGSTDFRGSRYSTGMRQNRRQNTRNAFS